MKILWICGLPEDVRKVHPVTDVKSSAWSWVLGHLPPTKDVELHILCPVFGMKDAEVHFDYNGAHWHCFRLKRFEPLFLRLRFYLSIRKFVKGLKPDVIHGWGGESGCGLLATYCSSYAVVSVQGLLRMLYANANRWKISIPECGSVSSWFRRLLEGWTYRRAHQLLVESETAAESLRTLYGLEGEVVPHPLRREFLNHEIHERHEKECKFLFVGQMTARKGAMDALMAFWELDDKFARLLMVGSGDLDRKIDDFISKNGLGNRVRRIKTCSADELRLLMEASSAILVPSYGDTGPTILKEALSQGVYSICYDNTGAKELVIRYGYGRTVTTGDIEALRNAMDDVVSRRLKNLEECGVNVIRRICDDLSPEDAWGNLLNMYSRANFEVPLQKGGALGQRIGHFSKILHEGSSVVISFNTGLRQNLSAVLRAKRAGRVILREINEWPLSVTWKESRFKQWVEIHVLPKFFDGAICISDVLVDFWKLHGRKRVPIFKLPMTVDVAKISDIEAKKSDVPYVCYAGGLTEEKDGIETLKSAFAIVKECHPEVALRIVSGVSHHEAVSVMKGASCLVLARPDSLQAQAGFPTKLGEYLATGRPVVVTRTGEIDRYLVDGKSAYLAEQGNAKDIARQIDAVLSDPDAARVVGEAGRRVAIECFDWHVHKDELMRWMKQFT